MDMPAIGPRTVELAVAARLAGVAVEAGAVLMLDRDGDHPCRQRARLRHGRIGERRALSPDVPGPRMWRGVSWGARARVCATGPISPAAGRGSAARPFRYRLSRGRGPCAHPGVCCCGKRHGHARARGLAAPVGHAPQAPCRRAGVPGGQCRAMCRRCAMCSRRPRVRAWPASPLPGRRMCWRLTRTCAGSRTRKACSW